MAMFSLFLSGVALGLSLLSILLSYLTYPAFHQSNSDKVVRAAAEQTHLMESVRGIQTIKMYDLEWERASLWREFRADAMNAAARSQNVTGIIESTKSAVAAISTLAIMVIGAREVLTTSDFTIGELISFLIYVRVFSDRLSSLLTGVNRLRLLGLHLDRLSDAVSQPISGGRSSYEYVEQSPPFRGGIELRDIWFRYSPFDAWIFKGASLKIEPGEYVSIIGESGGGKTTLMRIMLGLLQIESGEILIDGKAATPTDFKKLRANAGVVTQDDSLFSGSIRENIVLYRHGVTHENVEAAARNASIADHIESLPMKYETLIGDMGSSLSAGQKQRVFLARALLLSPSLIFLDEGTANLDSENEAHVVRIVNAMSCTRISITHRPAFAEAAAKVYRVDASQIVRA
jgi:ATP-binding cassette subfamily B protein RaxB